MKECPHCGAKSPDDSTKCQFCRKGFDEPVSEVERATLLKQKEWDSQNELPKIEEVKEDTNKKKENIGVRTIKFFKKLDEKKLSVGDILNSAFFISILLWCSVGGINSTYHIFHWTKLISKILYILSILFQILMLSLYFMENTLKNITSIGGILFGFGILIFTIEKAEKILNIVSSGDINSADFMGQPPIYIGFAFFIIGLLIVKLLLKNIFKNRKSIGRWVLIIIFFFSCILTVFANEGGVRI